MKYHFKEKSMDINFIKWMVGYADGFEFDNYVLECSDDAAFYMGSNTESMKDVFKKTFDNIYYPLLLQRAIEGVNRDCPYIWIVQDEWIRVMGTELQQELMHKDSFDDQAKESALKYIYEQEAVVPVDAGLPNVHMPGEEEGKWGFYGYSDRTLDRAGFDEFKTRFYELQGWDTSTGYPTRAALEPMGLAYVADELEAHGKLGA